MKPYPYPKELKPVWGDRHCIDLVRKYDEIRNAKRPVVLKSRLRRVVDDDGYVYRNVDVECPFCFIEHDIVIDDDDKTFYNDSNYCLFCESEFILTENDEVYINPRQC